MILGEKILKTMYPDLDDNQYQPAGIDLKLGRVMYFDNKSDVYGIVNGNKQLPNQLELDESIVRVDGNLEAGYLLQPNTSYIGVVKSPIKIPKDCAQIYLPRSSLLRAGVDVRTALGDPGFNGHLSFLLINHNTVEFFIKKNERFVQMINLKVDGVENEYDGDYQEQD